nr:T9SS type A sorting domain-containing protein [Bacteroidota bacterium]
MKAKLFSLILATAFVTAAGTSKAQTTAMNYDFTDCAGNSQSIFADLDAGKAVIIEFFMTSCSPCITAGQTLELMKSDLMAEYPGMIKAYAFGFSNSYSCSTINTWVTNNGITSIPADSGGAQVAYYGGMGMPTIVILGGGTSHSVLGAPYVGFVAGDTVNMAGDIRNFLNGTGINENNQLISALNVFPNPANSEVKVVFELKSHSDVKVDLYDVTGRHVAVVADKKDQVGKMSETINTSLYATGSYVVKINANGTTTQQKLNILH